MKILMVIHGFPPECSGGTESYVLRLCLELLRHGHEVEVFCGSHEGAGPGRWEPRLVTTEHESITVHRLHRTGLYVDNWEKSLAPEVEPALGEVIDRVRPHLVHVHHWIRLTRNLIEIAHDRGVPAVCTLHDLWSTCPIAFRVRREDGFCHRPLGPESCFGCAPAGENMEDDEQRRELALFRDDLQNELSLARRLILPSAAHRDVLLEHAPELRGRFRVVPHGNISILERRRPGRRMGDDQRLVIGHWGHLSFLKGIDLLLSAVGALEDPRAVKLELFGDVVYPDERPLVDELAAELDVTWHGAFTPDDLARVPMDLAVIPTRCSESWSLVLDEAFLLGLPAVVPDRGALADRIGGAGATFKAESPHSLAEVLARVVDHPGDLREWRREIPSLGGFREHTTGIARVYDEVHTSHAPLPTTPLSLRHQRLAVRSYELELRNRQLEGRQGSIDNLRSDLDRAQASMARMEYYHGEKDKELERLTKITEHAEITSPEGWDELVQRVSQLEARWGGAADETAEAFSSADAADATLDVLLRVHRGQLDETLKRRATELEAILQARVAQVGALESRLADVLLGQVRLELAGENRERLLEADLVSERRAVKRLRGTILDQRDRLASLEQKSAEFMTRLRNMGSGLEEVVQEARRRLPGDGTGAQDLDAALDEELAALEPMSSLPERISESLPTEINATTDDIERLLDHTLARQLQLQQLLEHRDQMIDKMTGTVNGLIERVSSLERKRNREGDQVTPRHRRPGDRLKIMMVVHQFLPRHVAGTEIYTYILAKQLAQRHDVLILTAESDHSMSRFEESRHLHRGLQVHQVIHNYEWENFRDIYDCPEVDAIFRRLLREEKPDVVHIQHLHYWSSNFVTIAHARGIPVVYTLHDYMLLCPRDGTLRRADGELCMTPVPSKCRDCIAHVPLDGQRPPVVPRGLDAGAEALVPEDVARIVRRSRRWTPTSEDPHEEAAADRLDYLHNVVGDVDLFVSPSQFLKERFVEAGLINADRIVVSDNGFDLGRLRRSPPRSNPAALRVGYVGTIAEHKGIHTLIEAVNGIDDPRVSLRIWGDLAAFHEYTERLRGMISHGDTLLMGPFPNDRIDDVLARLDLLVIPSLWFENSPLTVHEAALAGVPVLASDQGGLAEYVHAEVTGRHFRLGDVDDLRAKILSFLSAPLPGFDPSRLPIKTIEQDARDTEARYERLLTRASTMTV